MGDGRLGIGLAGLGVHGQRYAAHLLAGDVPRAHLAAVHRRRADEGRAWARAHGVTHHESLDDLIEDPRVDAVVAVLPPSLHPGAVVSARRAGLPVLVEKPLARNAPEARRVVDECAGAGPPAMVAQTLRFDSVVATVKRELPGIGPLHLAAVNHRFEPSGRPWLDDPDEGGLLLNTGVHGVDLLRFLTGAEITEVRALGRSVVLRRVRDLFAAVMRLEPGGILATLDNSRATSARTGGIELVGERGQLIADHVHGTIVRIEGRKMTRIQAPEPVPTVREALRAFVDAVLDGEPVPIPLSEGLAAVEAVEKIRDAMTEAAQ